MSSSGDGNKNRPSIRLNLGGGSSGIGSSNSARPSSRSTSPLPTSNKKRRFTAPPASTPPNTATASNLQVLHQKSFLSFVFSRQLGKPVWYGRGETTLYLAVSDDRVYHSTETTPKPTTVLQLALHGRVKILDVQAEVPGNNNQRRKTLQVQHLDPLLHILWKPASSTVEDDDAHAFHADAQSSRSTLGITTALRAASIASNTMGEVRVSVLAPANSNATVDSWKQDLLQPPYRQGGRAVTRLQESLFQRAAHPRQARLDLVAKRLAAQPQTLKVTLKFRLPLDEADHLGGLHSSSQIPCLYTTAGVLGDSEGPRCWIPCLDSAQAHHRATHELTIKTTARMREGLSAVGCGQDFGVSETFLHSSKPSAMELGIDHVNFVQACLAKTLHNSHHVIPEEDSSSGTGEVSMDSVLATHIWCTHIWTPIPARSLGFAIGPFKVLNDPEYLAHMENHPDETAEAVETNDDDDDELQPETQGEGIRQVYLAALCERKRLHLQRKTTNLLPPHTRIQLRPLAKEEQDLCRSLDRAVTYGTVGVPLRALSMMRDVLAVPTYPTIAYTQIWIPHAVHGGSTSGSLACCPEAIVNPFLGGAIMDARLLPPPGQRLPYYQGGRVLQFLQARCAIRGWITAALPLGGRDDVGHGYLYSLIESFIVSLYARGHGGQGEGGGKGGMFYTKRYAAGSGLNSSNLDFLPVQNIEESELDVAIGGVVGAVPLEDRNNDQFWRSATNGTESHTSSADEYAVREVLLKDVLDVLERGTGEKSRNVPLPSNGWMGSHLSLSFLSSNAASSSDLGCGALELQHPVGGLVYRYLKSEVLRKVVEGRAGVASFIRLVRACFVAAHLDDMGETELKMPSRKKDKGSFDKASDKSNTDKDHDAPKPPFIVCVNELMKKKGLTHTLFTRALQNLAGRMREAHLLGVLVDVEPEAKDPRNNKLFVEPEGFPNSYVRGASELYLRVGVFVEPPRDTASTQAQSAALLAKGIPLQVYAEPVIPKGGIAFGGPVTIRVVENEGQFREYVKELSTDGSRRDWSSIFLHAKPVTLPKAQTAASGTIESATASNAKDSKTKDKDANSAKRLIPTATAASAAFTDSLIHSGGYQAIELIRLCNLTPLLWVRVDPMGLFGGRISVVQPDACYAEQLFHDGDAGAQVDAIRSLAERPLRIRGTAKVTAVYDVKISELPVRVLGDCLRGSPALHSSLPHTPSVRAQAALGIAQWQNNKAPPTKDAVGGDHWLGINLLIQYVRERFFSGIVMPCRFTRVALKRNLETETEQIAAAAEADGSAPHTVPTEEDLYYYLDSLDDKAEKMAALEEAEEIDIEEDEEYRVRSSVITSIAAIRAKDGQTPAVVLRLLESIIDAEDAEMVGSLVSAEEDVAVEKKLSAAPDGGNILPEGEASDGRPLPYVSSMLIADALLALCHINASPALIADPTTGKPVQSKSSHPVQKLIEIAYRWVKWELYRENVRAEVERKSCTGVGGGCHDTVAACAITALSSLCILRQSTTDPELDPAKGKEGGNNVPSGGIEEVVTAEFYMGVCMQTQRTDVTRAACAQAAACICCAADRFEKESVEPVGLLTALEFMLDRIQEPTTSPGLRQTLALLMMDASTGKICSMQRVGAIGGRNDLVTSAARFLGGPLGTSNGGDEGSALLTIVSPNTFPAASAVNDGARRGVRLLSKAGRPGAGISEKVVVRIALFATSLWRTINGEPARKPNVESLNSGSFTGVCAYDGSLRCSLLALWQWIWPKGCASVAQVQAFAETRLYKELGADGVMKTTDEEKRATAAEDKSLAELGRLVSVELDRQQWRGEMASKAYSNFKTAKGSGAVLDVAAAEQGIGQPLPPIERDAAFKHGGWIASAAQQRREKALDGGSAVTKLRLTLAEPR